MIESLIQNTKQAVINEMSGGTIEINSGITDIEIVAVDNTLKLRITEE
ncbi:MAG: hypothetical protein MJ203_03325 [archaeon]|nr:hypothetical protein [archaeon]